MSQRIVKRLNPDTALEDLSIWRGINRRILYSQCQELAKKPGPGRQCYTGSSNANANDSWLLSSELERTLVDDIAFVAAIQPRAEFVSAAAVEQSQTCLLFRLAANEGVSELVKEHFDRLFETLRTHAKKGKSVVVSSSDYFTHIDRHESQLLSRAALRKHCSTESQQNTGPLRIAEIPATTVSR